MNNQGQLRLQNVAGHIFSTQKEDIGFKNETNNLRQQNFEETEHVKLLPEKLSYDNPEFVVRSGLSPYKLIKTYDSKLNTLYDTLENSIKTNPQVNFLGWREQMNNGQYSPYKWLTYKQGAEIRNHIGSALIQCGLKPKDTIGLYSGNCPEWVLMQSGAYSQSLCTVPLYDTLGPDSAHYICTHAELKLLGVQYKNLKNLLKCLEQKTDVSTVVVWDYPKDFNPDMYSSSAKIIAYEQFLKLGQQNPKQHTPPSPEDICSLYYTSGTTGNPKGVLVPHSMLMASLSGAKLLFDFPPGHRHLSFLPLAHIFERQLLESSIALQNSVGFFHGDVMEIMDDIQALRPQSISSVPRIWNRIYERVMSQILNSNIVARNLFWYTYNQRLKSLQSGRDPTEPLTFMEKTVFRKIQQALGGELELVISGGSPINKEVYEFMKVTFGCVVVEGYGLTETAAALTIQHLKEYMGGQVGFPVQSAEFKLVDIPDMGYMTSDQPYSRGEICCRGPSIFPGYYKNEEATREAIDDNGWFHTGDVGMLIEKNRLKIIDRKKNLFKLAQGEYVSPEKLENTYLNSPFVDQCFIHGDSLQTKLVAVVHPSEEYLMQWAQTKGVGGSFEEICNNPRVIREVLLDLQEVGKAKQLNRFEIVAALHLTPMLFGTENDLLTPSMKLKRNTARKIFEKNINKMYQELSQ